MAKRASIAIVTFARDKGNAACVLLLAVLFTAIVFFAWVNDDAHITFRTVDNLLDGFGLRWNPDERVQSYTHPLWMFVLAASGLLSRHLYLNSVFLGVLFSMAAAGLISLRLARTHWHGLLTVMIMVASAAYRDYSTSGLENPLAHILLVLFMSTAIRESPPMGRLSLLFSAICLNRLDHAVLTAPVLAVAFARSRAWLPVAAGLIPLAAWEIFSVAYYGVPFPNTAYAKLSTGIDPALLGAQGLHYMRNSLFRDPVTLAAILGGAAAGACSRRYVPMASAFGIVVYLLYIIRIGGDFMAGRFLSAPLVVALVLLARMEFGFLRPRLFIPAFGLIGAVGAYGVLRMPGLPLFDDGGVADERRAYVEMWLRRFHFGSDFPDLIFHRAAKKALAGGDRVVYNQNIGVMGYVIKRRAHIVDPLGLSDPLLARLPMQPQPWRVGHYMRSVPDGYHDTLMTGVNRIADPGIARLWDDIVLLTRAPLTAPGRWDAIVRMNTGAHDAAIRAWAAPVPVSLTDLGPPRTVNYRGVEIALPEKTNAALDIECEGNDPYYVLFLRNGKLLAGIDIPPATPPQADLRLQRVTPPPAATAGYDTIRIHPRWGDWSYRIGRVRTVP